MFLRRKALVVRTLNRMQWVPAWKAETIIGRLQSCRAMLALHGVLSEAENARVLKRIAKEALTC